MEHKASHSIVETVQYSTVQYSTVQYSTVQYSTVQYSTVQYSTVQYSTVQYSTVQYSTVQYSTVQYSTVQYSTVQYSTVQQGKMRYSTDDLKYCSPQAHLSKCPKAPVECPNTRCKENVARSDLPQHLEEECSFRRKPCAYCSNMIVQFDMDVSTVQITERSVTGALKTNSARAMKSGETRWFSTVH